MVMSSGGRKVLCKFASKVVGDGTPRLLSQLEHWVEHKGVEWLSERWKAIRNSAYMVREGRSEDARALMVEKGIAIRKDKTVSKGEFGRLQLAFIEAETPYQLRAADALLRGYTALICPAVTQKQVAKARKTITSVMEPVAGKRKGEFESWNLPSLVSGQRTDGIRVPTIYGLSGVKSFYCGTVQVPKEIRALPFGSAVVSALTVGYLPKSVVSLLGDHPLRQQAYVFQQRGEANVPGTVGKIAFLQEGGCKARVVALPSFWCQAYFKPLQDELVDIVRRVERRDGKALRGISCVGDQNRGAYALKSWMESDSDLYSYDLSAATDRFPLEIQLAYLEKCGLGEWKESVRDIARSDFLVPHTGERWKYQVGQPMGLNFSFPLFHLTHMSVLESVACQHAKKPGSLSYAVLGDDVIISDRGMAESYKRIMSALGLEISHEKSHEGVKVQTFAGFSGLATSRGVQVFRPFKHGVDFAMEGRELNTLATFGPKVRSWSDWWSRSFDQLNRTYPLREPDLSPIPLESREVDCRFGDPGSRWFTAVAQRVVSSPLVQKDPITGERKERGYSRRIMPGSAAVDEHNRLWAGLLREKKALYQDSFSPDEYVKRERAALHTNQLTRDPLIREQRKIDEVRKQRLSADCHGR